jgi:nitrite reductase/ring-hydroxylating ferredoxin subunit
VISDQSVGYRHDLSSIQESESPESLSARGIQNVPPPYPYGWFAVAFSYELRAGSLITRRFMDREIVLFRTSSGNLQAIESYCPHLGAHIGHGGTVEGEELRCPFHGFRFSASGRCTHSPYGRPPPAARLGCFDCARSAVFCSSGTDRSGKSPGRYHGFDLTPVDHGTRVHHNSRHRGLAVPLLRPLMTLLTPR